MTKAKFWIGAALLSAGPWPQAWPTPATTGTTATITTGRCPTRSATSTITAPVCNPAVLPDIGGSALAAEDGRGAVIIGEGAGLQAGAVIVEVADLVGQAPVVVVAVVPTWRASARLGARATADRRAAPIQNFALVISFLRKSH